MSRPFSPRSTLALALALTALTSCRYGTPPQLEASLLPPAPVTSALGAKERGRLVSMPDGAWSIVAADQLNEALGELAHAPPGSVIAVWPSTALQSDARPNLFTVTHSRSWGLVLQRLDDGPINTNVKVQAAQVSPLSDLSALGLCFGSGDPLEARCLTEAPAGTRYDLYASDRIGSLAIIEDDGSLPRRPAARVAMLHSGPDKLDVLGDLGALPSAWVAVRSARSHAPWPIARAVIDDGCALDASRWPLSATTTPLELAKDASLFEVEGAAFARGADVLIAGCEGNETVFAIPSLSRHHLEALTGRTLGPSMLGSRPIVISGLDPARRALIATALGMAARGDWSASAAAFEFAFLTLDRPGQLGRLGMEVIATSGHTELAIRAATVATKDAWNPESDVAVSLGMAAVYGALGFERELLAQESRTSTIAAREGGPDALWWRWRSFAVAVRGGEFRDASALAQVEEAFAVEEDDATWWLSIYAARKMVGELDGMERAKHQELTQRAGVRGGEALWRAIEGELAPLDCVDDSDCTLDSYGRTDRHDASSLDRALRAHPGAWAPGYEAALGGHAKRPTHLDDWLRQVVLDAYADPNASRDALLAHATTLGARADGSWCANLRAGQSASYTLRSLPSPRRAASWLTGEALEAVCAHENDPSLGVEELVLEEVRSARWKVELTGALLRGALARSTPEALTERLVRASSFARSRQLVNACAEWSAALSLAHLEAGRLLDAQKHGQDAIDCDPDDPDALIAAQLARALAQRARQGTLSGSIPTRLRDRVEEVERSVALAKAPECPALVSVGDAPARTIIPRVSNLADRATVPSPPQDAIRLATRNERVETARELMKEAHDALLAADAATARGKLRSAREQVELANDAPSARAVAFAAAALFPEGLGDGKPLSGAPADPALVRVRKGEASALLSESAAQGGPDAAQRDVVAALLLLEAPDSMLTRALELGGARTLPGLCALP